jgi:hypothetical protein
MRLPAGRVDVALLPAGGWDSMRGRRHLDLRGVQDVAGQVAPDDSTHDAQDDGEDDAFPAVSTGRPFIEKGMK